MLGNDASKKIVHANLASKVKDLLWCEEMDYLTVCLNNGMLITIDVEVFCQGIVEANDEPEKTKMWMSKAEELKVNRKLLQSPDNPLLSFNYI